MDQILSKASNQVVSFAIRSGISIASGYAIKTISTFVDKIPVSQQQRLSRQRHKLKTKIDIINVTIDLIKLAASRGNTVLESTLELIEDLHSQFTAFDEGVNDITAQLSSANTKESVKRVEDYMRDLMVEINDAIPILNLSLITSGINLNGMTNFNAISPGRLLQASDYLNKGSDAVGPAFDLVMYTIFYNPSRMKYVGEGDNDVDSRVDELSCITWKETFARSSVQVTNDGKNGEFKYTLIIEEDFNDGRFHGGGDDDDDDDDDAKPKVKVYDLKAVQSMFFTASGKLLRLEGRNLPVLILKIVDGDKEEWIALGELHSNEFDDEEDDSDEDDSETKGNTKISRQQIKSSSLSLLEYIIRLARLQQIENKSILTIPDEVLKMYLHDQSTSADLPKSISQKSKHDAKLKHTEDRLTMDSNIARLKNLEIAKSKK
ncbi:YRB30 [Candida theae]|uniref:YRB30 n=1 Tax=Candida theae TaxID=1198502 RepID=A0AAD5FWY2_9ASCO|nr:YRB30 [Candida theae]KAI5949763.1 YRB30 [Candida theae]